LGRLLHSIDLRYSKLSYAYAWTYCGLSEYCLSIFWINYRLCSVVRSYLTSQNLTVCTLVERQVICLYEGVSILLLILLLRLLGWHHILWLASLWDLYLIEVLCYSLFLLTRERFNLRIFVISYPKRRGP